MQTYESVNKKFTVETTSEKAILKGVKSVGRIDLNGKVKRANVGEKKELEVQLNLLLEDKKKLSRKLVEIDRQIAQTKDKIQAAKPLDTTLIITTHAVDRFRSRIMNLPTQKIKKLLSHPVLQRFSDSCGEGRIYHPEFDYCTVVIKDRTVVTVINKNDPDEKIDQLHAYMTSCIDHPEKKETFEQYRKRLFR